MKYQGFFLMLFYFFNVWNVYLDHPLCFLNSFKPKLMVQNKRLFMDTYFPTVGICCSDAKSCPTLLWPHGLQHAKLPFPSLSPGACSNSCPLSRWWHPTISSSAIPFSSCLQSFPSIRVFFQWVKLFASGGQSIGASASASVLPMNIQGWFPVGLTGLISLLPKGLSRVFSSTTVWNGN